MQCINYITYITYIICYTHLFLATPHFAIKPFQPQNLELVLKKVLIKDIKSIMWTFNDNLILTTVHNQMHIYDSKLNRLGTDKATFHLLDIAPLVTRNGLVSLQRVENKIFLYLHSTVSLQVKQELLQIDSDPDADASVVVFETYVAFLVSGQKQLHVYSLCSSTIAKYPVAEVLANFLFHMKGNSFAVQVWKPGMLTYQPSLLIANSTTFDNICHPMAINFGLDRFPQSHSLPALLHFDSRNPKNYSALRGNESSHGTKNSFQPMQLQERFSGVNSKFLEGVTQATTHKTIEKVDGKILCCSKSKDSFGYIYQILSFSKQVVVRDSRGMYLV